MSSAGESCTTTVYPSVCLLPCDASSERTCRNHSRPWRNSAPRASHPLQHTPRSCCSQVLPIPEWANTPGTRWPHSVTPSQACPSSQNPQSLAPFPEELSSLPPLNGTSHDVLLRSSL